jgi:glycopeptide antibiotics resistance protein
MTKIHSTDDWQNFYISLLSAMNIKTITWFRIALLIYSLGLAYAMLFGFGRYPHAYYRFNLVPFHSIGEFIQIWNFDTRTWTINLLGNIFVFIPFGLLIPNATRSGLLRSLGYFLTGILVMEVMQLISARGTFDIDDFLLNAMGFLMGFGMYRLLLELGWLKVPD